MIIDKWDHCCVSFSSQPIALAGSTSVRYEMHELGGSADAYLSWAATDALQGNGWLASSYIETIAITDGMDDIEVNLETNGVDKSSSDLELINDGNDQAVALLFRGLQVDNGASILSATIQFHADESQDEPTNLEIRALTCTDAAPCAPALPRRPVFVTQSTFGDRPLTRNSAAWVVEPWSVASHETSTQSEAPQVIAAACTRRFRWVAFSHRCPCCCRRARSCATWCRRSSTRLAGCGARTWQW